MARPWPGGRAGFASPPASLLEVCPAQNGRPSFILLSLFPRIHFRRRIATCRIAIPGKKGSPTSRLVRSLFTFVAFTMARYYETAARRNRPPPHSLPRLFGQINRISRFPALFRDRERGRSKRQKWGRRDHLVDLAPWRRIVHDDGMALDCPLQTRMLVLYTDNDPRSD